MRSAWISRLALLAVVAVTGVLARQQLDAMTTAGEVIEAPQLPRFLLLHGVSALGFFSLLWLGIPNARDRRWIARANLTLKVFAVPGVVLLAVVQWRFWTAIF